MARATSGGQHPLAKAIGLEQSGRISAAEKQYRLAIRSLSGEPMQIEAMLRLADMLRRAGRSGEALPLAQKATKLAPDMAEAQLTSALVYNGLERTEAALAAAQAALSINPKLALAQGQVGVCLRKMGQIEAATLAMERAAALDPTTADYPFNCALFERTRGRMEAAVSHFEQALALRPDMVLAHSGLGNVLQQMGRLDEALSAFQTALKLAPKDAERHRELAFIYAMTGQDDEAAERMAHALELQPDQPDLRLLLAAQRRVQGRLDEAEALAADPLTDKTLNRGSIQPFALLPLESTPAQQLAAARAYVETTQAEALAADRPAQTIRPVDNDRLTVGYLSSDLRRHPVGVLMADVLEHHDQGRYRLIAYATREHDNSPVRARIGKAVERLVDLHATSGAEAAARIQADGVDLLVDLNGHTQGNRQDILVQRPAPVQVAYLGYAGTSGAPYMDYVIADRKVLPQPLTRHFSEQPAYLTGSYMPALCGHPQPSTTKPRAAYGLPEGALVLCAFHNPSRVLAGQFEVWLSLLQALPEAVLWLSARSQDAEAHLRALAEVAGVDGQRLVFAGHMPSLADHLARYRVADLFLDNYPYTAHSTMLDVLWVGCPVVSRMGATMVSRIGGSLLQAAGQAEWVSDSAEGYVAQVMTLAQDGAARDAIRVQLQGQREHSALFDPVAYTAGLERLYDALWARAQSGQPPAPVGPLATD